MQESGLRLARSGASMRASGPNPQPFHRFAGRPPRAAPLYSVTPSFQIAISRSSLSSFFAF